MSCYAIVALLIFIWLICSESCELLRMEVEQSIFFN